MSSDRKLLAARVILTVIAVGTIVSPFLADWNATHIYNPLWPPHAKFHNAQTMSLALLLGLAALFFTWRRGGDGRGDLFPPGCSPASTGSANPSRSHFPESPGPTRTYCRPAPA